MYNYIVCGGLGFISSEICRQLLQLEGTKSLLIVDNDYKGYGTSNIKDLLNDKRLEIWDIDLTCPTKQQSENLLQRVGKAHYVINGAAVIGGVGLFTKLPATILRNNNLINTTMLDLVVTIEPQYRPIYVGISSSMIFEGATEFPSKESDLKNTKLPLTSYGLSKICVNYYHEAYAQEFGLKYITIIPWNCIGGEKPRKDYVGWSHCIPDLILKIKNGQGTKENPLEILGAGMQVRHYTSQSEIASGIITCLQSEKAINQDFNIAIWKGHSVIEVANLIWKYMRPNEDLHIKNVPAFPYDVQYRSPDIQKMKDFFGWEAKLTLDETMPEIIESVLVLLED